jgi:predicted Zn-dependent protease
MMKTIRTIAGLGMTAVFCLAASFSAPAQAQALIRDSEIEALIAGYAAPILRAAELNPENIRIHLVNDSSFNAFVADGRNMFLHTGALAKAQTPNQLIGVIAHETGHIEGSHLARSNIQLERAKAAAMWFQALGIVAMGAGAVTGDKETVHGGNAVMQGGETVAMRSFLMYRRAEESAADQAGMRYLNATKQSGKGMLEIFQLFAQETMGGRVDPYAQTHPMPADRIAQLEDLVTVSPYADARDPLELQMRHDMVRAKLDAYSNRKRNKALVYRLYPETNSSLPARYARSIVTCYTEGAEAAVPLIEQLIADQPDNPYLYELEGQCLMEEGGAEGSAVAPLRRAVQLAPKASLIRILLARALLGTGDDSLLSEAVENLRQALVYEEQNGPAFLELANAYARLNRLADADLATAQGYFYSGRFRDARERAQRAQTAFPLGSPNWIKADDIVNFQPPKRGG